MTDHPAHDEAVTAPAEPPAAALEDENANSTVGTGSVLGLGCLAVVVVLVVLAVVYRLLGGSW